MKNFQNDDVNTSNEPGRILARRLARPMNTGALFNKRDESGKVVLDYSELGTTCTDANGEEDSS